MDTIDLSDFFNTKAEAEDFSSRMNSISKQIFETSFNPNAALLNHFGIEKREAFMTLLRENNFNADSRKGIKDFIDLLLSKIVSLPVISLVISFEPTQETLKLLSRWFVINTKKQVIFDIKVDPKLIGGAAILSNGKYMDFSIKPHFDKVFEEITNPKVINSQIAK